MVSGLPVYRGHGVTRPGIKIRFMVDPNVRFATEGEPPQAESGLAQGYQVTSEKVY